jgi:hypothetical protein
MTPISMVQCPKCSAQNPQGSRFCNSCGENISSASQMPTAEYPAAESPKAPAQTPHVARIISSDSIPVGGFTPGTILADRYRIIGLLGRGGMGEVYRADDLKLGQPVALKFLPPKLADDPVRRERFFAEVRITRQLSHPNICRVYDIQEIEGRHFLSMEFIDGEDLASLIRRIGHLSNEKALDIARQLAAGLAAAHERGVLHRDLKPANIMLDGHGHVRITDFGIAIAAEDETQAAEIAGTPAYMAPEQLAGKGASVRSDMYSLGLVLYEIYTGKKAFTATTLAELREQKETHTPRAISEIREGMDPVVERLIRRCMERDPNARPASVAQLALALPGGDPLAAALAAGETPSPEMVAASGSTEGLKPWIAWVCLAFIFLGIGTAVMLGLRAQLFQRVPMDKPPDALVEIARGILTTAGYPDLPADSAFGFESSEAYFQYIDRNEPSPNRYDTIPPFALQFWYRQSPRPLGPLSPSLFYVGGVTLTDPPPINDGESIVWLDSTGRLTGLQVIPSQQSKPYVAAAPMDWAWLFKAAGLNAEKLASADINSIPPVYADALAASTGMLPDRPNVPVRIEAAALQGKPVLWRMILASADKSKISAANASPSSGRDPVDRFRLIMTPIAFVVAAFFARRNLLIGRGDRRGAMRFAIFFFAVRGIAWIFGEHHVATTGGLEMFLRSAAIWLAGSAELWCLYIAFEPIIRRRWPSVLVGWSRLLAGSFRDPLVGRDLLIGCLMGVVLTLLSRFPTSLLFGLPQGRPSTGAQIGGIGTLYLLSGTRAVVAGIMQLLFTRVVMGLIMSFGLFLLRRLLRSTWAAGNCSDYWGHHYVGFRQLVTYCPDHSSTGHSG